MARPGAHTQRHAPSTQVKVKQDIQAELSPGSAFSKIQVSSSSESGVCSQQRSQSQAKAESPPSNHHTHSNITIKPVHTDALRHLVTPPAYLLSPATILSHPPSFVPLRPECATRHIESANP